MVGRMIAAEVPDCRMRSPLPATPQLNYPKLGCAVAMQYAHCVVPVDVPEHPDVLITPDDGRERLHSYMNSQVQEEDGPVTDSNTFHTMLSPLEILRGALSKLLCPEVVRTSSLPS